ncbi:ferredoxin--NADP reductase [Buchnera aphidicola]|uniref:ferredoxin--NADP reductase n=1 Tax=Buchnera aphidicola TaxID=9 RepID=UPI0030EBB1A3
MTNWIPAKIQKIRYFNNKNLLKIILTAKIDCFIAGQFSKILIKKKNKNIQRAYSFVNAPKKKKIEFYITLVKKGEMSNELKNLNDTDKIFVSKQSFGYFTLIEIKKSFENLWMISTGTGIGPYLSILQEKKNLQKFKKIILIQSVRYFSDLIYLSKIKKLKKIYKKKLIVKISISREKKKNFLNKRLTKLLKNKFFEKSLNIKMNKKNSHIMLCGNPNMVQDVQKWLINKKKMTKNLRKFPGNITIEKYW